MIKNIEPKLPLLITITSVVTIISFVLHFTANYYLNTQKTSKDSNSITNFTLI